MKDDRVYLQHIAECIARIEEYTAGGETVFLQDTKTQDAVVRNLQTMTESTTRLSGALKQANRALIGQRSSGSETFWSTTISVST